MDTVAAKPSAAACSRCPGDTEEPSATSHEGGLGSYGKRLVQGGPRFRWRKWLWNNRVAGLHNEPLGPQVASSGPDLVYRITGSIESRKLSLGQVPALPSAEAVISGGCKAPKADRPAASRPESVIAGGAAQLPGAGLGGWSVGKAVREGKFPCGD